MLAQEPVREAAQAAMRELQSLAARHPCVLALGWGSNLDPKAAAGGRLESWGGEEASPWPYYASTVLAMEIPGALMLLKESAEEESLAFFPEIPAYMQPGDDRQEAAQQALRLDRTLHDLAGERSPFMVAWLADWVGEQYLIWNPPGWNPLLHQAGVTDFQRRPREAYSHLAQYVRGDYPDLYNQSSQNGLPPWDYFVFGLSFTVAVVWLTRIDRSWRKNLRRALSHYQGLVGDIRNRRFQQGAQSALLGILAAAGIGNLWAAQLHHHRLDPGLAALLQNLLESPRLLMLARTLVWQPLQGIIILTLVVLGLAVVFALAMRFACYRQRPRFTLAQALSLVIWSGVPALAVLPLSTMYLHLTVVPALQWIAVILAYWSLLWSYGRALGAMQRVCRGYLTRPLMVGLGLPLLALLIYLIHLHVTRETLYYLGFFTRIFSLGG
jgi:hypothetical protein